MSRKKCCCVQTGCPGNQALFDATDFAAQWTILNAGDRPTTSWRLAADGGAPGNDLVCNSDGAQILYNFTFPNNDDGNIDPFVIDLVVRATFDETGGDEFAVLIGSNGNDFSLAISFGNPGSITLGGTAGASVNFIAGDEYQFVICVSPNWITVLGFDMTYGHQGLVPWIALEIPADSPLTTMRTGLQTTSLPVGLKVMGFTISKDGFEFPICERCYAYNSQPTDSNGIDVCSARYMPSSFTSDLGSGGWTNNVKANCAEVHGEVILDTIPKFYIDHRGMGYGALIGAWSYLDSATGYAQGLDTVAVDATHWAWQLTVGIFLSGNFISAIYRSAPQPNGTASCMSPFSAPNPPYDGGQLLLTKISESNPNNFCSGALPTVATLYAASP
jgi:hypothetical protein